MKREMLRNSEVIKAYLCSGWKPAPDASKNMEMFLDNYTMM